MNRKLIAVPAIAITAGLGIAACGTTVVQPAPVKPAATTPAPTTPAPAKTVIVQPAPAKTVYVQAPAAPAPPVQHVGAEPAQGNGLTACGSGVYAGAGTSCSFAFDVEQAYHAGGYWNQPGTSYFYADGQSMTSASVGNPVIVTDGSGDFVQFND